jgi:Mrp family chromosome partitioning ATPase
MATADRLKAALRLSRWLLLATTVAGVAAALITSYLAEPEYEAAANVLVSEIDASSVLPGAGSSSGDPRVQGATGVLLARTERYRREVVALLRERQTAAGPRTIVGDDIDGSYSVEEEPGTNILAVTGTTTSERGAIAIANAAAEAYPPYRGAALGESLRRTRLALERRLEIDGEDAQVRESLSRLRVLEDLALRSAVVVDLADSADRIRPAPVRAALVGLTSGLILGLLLMALREALATRVRDEDELEQLLGVKIVATSSGRFNDLAHDRLAVAIDQQRRQDGGTVIALVSATPREHRSTVAAGLVQALRRRGATVCAVDADPSAARLPAALELAGETEVPAAAIQGPAGSGELQLYGGHGAAASTVTNGSGHDGRDGAPFAESLERLRSGYDWVVIDAPAALESSTPAELSRSVDATIVVANPSALSRAELQRFARELSTWPRPPSAATIVER